jgi:DNA repair exonuclease SbcCD nuclease subunit
MHFHQYNNNITLQDVVNVTDQFIDICKNTSTDLILFLGDAAMSRNPMYEVSLAINTFFKKLNDLNIPVYVLPGNHDSITKNDHGLHNLTHLKLYPRDLHNIVVMDKRELYKIHLKNGTVALHAVPAGHEPINLQPEPPSGATWNICLFHTMVIGSKYSNGMPAEEGLNISSLDKEFDLVIGGDNHNRQELFGFKNAVAGYYVGAPMQHNWGDVGSERGFMEIEFDTEASNGEVDHFDVRYVNSNHPKFMRVVWTTSELDDVQNLVKNVKDWENNIVRLTIKGPSDILNFFDIKQWKEKLIDVSKARDIEIKLNYDVAVISSLPIDQNMPIDDTSEWKSFLKSKLDKLDAIDIEYIEKLGMKYINEN